MDDNHEMQQLREEAEAIRSATQRVIQRWQFENNLVRSARSQFEDDRHTPFLAAEQSPTADEIRDWLEDKFPEGPDWMKYADSSGEGDSEESFQGYHIESVPGIVLAALAKWTTPANTGGDMPLG
jgi:hypothetical protein